MPKAQPPEFRRSAVELARVGGKPQSELAQDLRISVSCLRNWVAQVERDEGGRDGVTSVERRELAEL